MGRGESTSRSCGRCDGENPTEARFCMHCAAPLGAVCGRCGAELPGDAVFCPRCAHPVDGGAREVLSETSRDPHAYTPKHLAEGEVDSRQPVLSTVEGSRVDSPRAYTPRHLAEKILNSRSALEGERKQVTVLFADVKGSMELAEQLDPEEWSQIMQRFLRMSTKLHPVFLPR